MGDHRIKSDLEIHWLEGCDKTREDFEIVKLYLVMSDVVPIKAGTSCPSSTFSPYLQRGPIVPVQ